MLETIFKHVRFLAVTLAHRGSCTENERLAHAYCAGEFQKMGYAPAIEPFPSIGSVYRPFILASGLLLFSYALFYLLGFHLLAILLALIATVSALLELAFIDNPLRWLLPKKQSRNVIAKLPARKKQQRKLILIAHIDSHRTPLIWRSPLTYKAYRVLSTFGMIAFVGHTGLLIWNAVAPLATAAEIALLPALFIFLIFIMTLEAELSPYSPGANDNASGAALLLALAREFAEAPPANTELWFVASGCEEVGAHGAFHFVAGHREELADAVFISLDNVAGPETSPCYYLSETMLRPLEYPGALVALAEGIAAQHTELQARPFAQHGAYTDGTPFLLAGIPGLSIVNHRADGWIPDWHNTSDTVDHIDHEALQKTLGFVRLLLEKLVDPEPPA